MLSMMTAAAEHEAPVGKSDTVDTWRQRGRMSVPAADGRIIDIWLVALYECTKVNGLPLDVLIEARKTRADPVKRFGVLFGETQPDWARYSVPVLWLREGEPDAGRWR
jgi:hypothetical protein